jgi:signal transduction histidine kinase
VAERTIAPALKAGGRKARGFESLPFRRPGTPSGVRRRADDAKFESFYRGLVIRLPRWRPAWLVDVAVAALCLVVDVSVVFDQLRDSGLGAGGAAAAMLAAVVGPLSLVWRQRRPQLVMGVVLATGGVLWAVGLPPIGHGPTVIVAMFTVGATLPRRLSLMWLGIVLGAVAVHQRLTWWVDGTSFAGNLVLLTGAWWMGDAARRRREEGAAHAARAEQLATAQEELAVRAVAEERLQIARELHDVVAHTMSAIAVQAGTGRVSFDQEPEVARASLAQIETLSRDALGEMRHLLAVLRPGDGPTAVRAPVASLQDLDRLVVTSAAAGVAVDVRVEGEPRPLPAGLDVTAFRIIQEALTNIARHGRTDHADVAICYGSDAVVIEIDNDGPLVSTTARPGGVGIVGMRERALAVGGTLVAAPNPAGGFRVVASLPMADGSTGRR